MSNRKPIPSGTTFGRWTVKAYINSRAVLCVCACGTEKTIDRANLLTARSTGCINCREKRTSEYLQYLFRSIDEHGDSDKCLVWPFCSCPKTGIGQVRYRNRAVAVTRIAIERATGSMPLNRVVSARCGTRGCYNPKHLTVPAHDEYRTCVKCGDRKTIEEFRKVSTKRKKSGKVCTGRDSTCKRCALRINYECRRQPHNIETLKRKQARYFQKHREEIDPKSKQWWAAHPEQKRLTALTYAHKVRVSGDGVKYACRDAIKSAFAMAKIGELYLDAYSGELITKPTIDHIMPVTRGGTNHEDNLCITSLENNASKSDDVLIVWLAKRATRKAL